MFSFVSALFLACANPPPTGGGDDDDDDNTQTTPTADTADPTPVDSGTPTDGDGDGVFARDDCDDTREAVYPGAPEVCGDGVVNDCDGTVLDAVPACRHAGEIVVDSAVPRTSILGIASAAAATDANGDGVAEIWTTTWVPGALHLVDGATAGSHAAADVSLGTVTLGQSASDSIAAGTDLTGDGVGEVVLGGPSRAFVVSEAPTPIGEINDVASFVFEDPGAVSYWDVAVGDLVGDAAADLVVYSELENDFGGVVWVMPGPLVEGGAPRTLAETTILGSPGGTFGQTLAVGDLDGDGVPDLSASSQTGPTAVFSGPLPGGNVNPSDADSHVAGDESWVGLDVVTPGDLDGDGSADLLLGQGELANLTRRIYLVGGPIASGVQHAPSLASAVFIGGAESSLGTAGAMAAWDADGDGISDLFIGDYAVDHGGGYGSVSVFFGPVPGGNVNVDLDADIRLDGTGTEPYWGFGWSVQPLVDQDGDGLPEFAVGDSDTRHVLSSGLLADPI